MVINKLRFLAEILLVTNCLFISVHVIQGKNTEKRVVQSIDSMLKFLQRPAVKSIRSSDGDIIDCVDLYKQPAFDNPDLANHTIQMKPSYIPSQDTMDDKNKSSSRIALQVWRKSGSCPEGTIPIRRVRKKDLLRFENLETFGKKNQQLTNASNTRQTHSNGSLVIHNTTLEVAYQPTRSDTILIASVTHYIGARGYLNVWNPRVEPDDYTTSQIWLVAGGPTDYETVESGWMVNPKLYGDTRTRFFVHWTTDGNHNAGCFDLLCSGFVQTSHELALGATIWPISYAGGPQYQIGIEITMDVMTGNWWLRCNDKIDLGYWPASILSDYLKAGAQWAQWGGELYSPNLGKHPHTTTAIGSGDWPQGLFGFASYISHIRSMDYSYNWMYPHYVSPVTNEPDCYATYHYVPGFMDEPTLFFGGPGGFQNPTCK